MEKINLEKNIYNQYDYLARVQTDSSIINYKENMLKAMKEVVKKYLNLLLKMLLLKNKSGVGLLILL
jgi:hypothetical protein